MKAKTLRFLKKNYDFSQERMFDNNLVFAYFVKRSDYVDEWYVVGMKFYNKTGKAPSIKISDFTVKDQNGKIIFTADDIVLDESKLYKAEKMTDNGYYRYYFGFDRTIKVEDVKDQCYYVSCTLNGTEFKDTLIRVEKSIGVRLYERTRSAVYIGSARIQSGNTAV